MTLTFYTNPRSRGQIIRWMLEEVGEPYETVVLDYGTTMKAEPYLSINPMGKVPAIVHDGKAVSECSAICAYLADAFPEKGLAPPLRDRADYYRWLFFAAGPIEAAFSNKAAGFVPTEENGRMMGYGCFETTIDTIEKAVSKADYIAGNKFSAADLYVASELGFMLMFGMLEPRPAFKAYVDRMTVRPAYLRAKEIDAALMAEPA